MWQFTDVAVYRSAYTKYTIRGISAYVHKVKEFKDLLGISNSFSDNHMSDLDI